jgi:uncharacterized Tic20 family protein
MTDTFEVPPDPNNPYASTANPDAALPNAPNVIETNHDARMWGMLCHLSSLATFVLPSFGNIIGPLVVWLIKKDVYQFVDVNGKESLNFQISMSIYLWVSTIVLMLTCFGSVLLFITVPALLIAEVVLAVIASLKANQGELYRYPLTLRFLT